MDIPMSKYVPISAVIKFDVVALPPKYYLVKFTGLL
jgi:hypothetical protein